MATIIKLLLVALCALSVNCLPAEDFQQASNVELGRSERELYPWVSEWLKSKGYRSQVEDDNYVKINRAISEAEDLVPSDVNSLPAKGPQPMLNIEPRPKIKQAIRRWRLKSWRRKSRPQKTPVSNVETSRAISEAENLVPSDQDIVPWDQQEVDAPLRERRFLGAVGGFVFKTVASTAISRATNAVINKFRGKRDLTAVESLPESSDEDVSEDDEDQFVSEAVENAVVEAEVEESVEAATPKNLQDLINEKVIKVEKFELPVLNINKWFKNKHDGVVVTLANGRRLLILKGYEFYRDQSTVVLDAEVMTDFWSLLESKATFETSTLGDYLRSNESSSSSLQAANNMMALD